MFTVLAFRIKLKMIQWKYQLMVVSRKLSWYYSIGFEFEIRLRARKTPGICFWKVPVTFRARKAVLCLPCLHSSSKFQKFWNYQLITKQNWLVCGLGTALLFKRFGFWNLPSGPKSFRAFWETGPYPHESGYVWNHIFSHKSIFCWRETSEHGHRNLTFLKPLSRVV